MIPMAEVDVIGGGVTATGWTAAAMLGAVLTWLFTRILPDKDKQVAALVERNDAMERERRADFKDSLRLVLEHGALQNQVVLEVFREEAALLRKIVEVSSGETVAARSGNPPTSTPPSRVEDRP
jgi:hypothetical protein